MRQRKKQHKQQETWQVFHNEGNKKANKNGKRSSILLVIREMKVRTTREDTALY